MSRVTLAVDRLFAVALGLALLAVGVIAVLWWSGHLPGAANSVNLSSISWLPPLTGHDWWPWALGVGGLLAALAGVRWLIGHVPDQGVSHLRLRGTNDDGQLRADAQPVGSAAAAAFTTTPGVRSARSSITRERGQTIVRILATIEPDAELQPIAAAADALSSQLRHVLERDDVTCRVQLRCARRSRGSRTVR